MKTMTLCVVAVVATAPVQGCGEEDTSPGAPAGGAETPDDPGLAAPTPAEPDEPPAQAGLGHEEGAAPRPDRTMATHVVISVRWPASIVLRPGEGEVHLWTKSELTFLDGTVSGTVRPCGSALPELTARPQLGGGKLKLQFPDPIWEAPGMPVFQAAGSSAGLAVGAAFTVDPLATVLGARMSDPLGAVWPEEVSQLDLVDPDGDGRPGVRSIPRTDAPYAAPPVDLAGVLDPEGPRADEVDLATRTVLSLAGTWDSPTSASGTAQVSGIDAHVVGCHVRGGGDCTPDQAGLIDAGQPRFTVESATFRMVDVPAGATCADVRAALPAG